jgi:hypothetical protein
MTHSFEALIDLILANTASIPAGSVPKISITPSSVVDLH